MEMCREGGPPSFHILDTALVPNKAVLGQDKTPPMLVESLRATHTMAFFNFHNCFIHQDLCRFTLAISSSSVLFGGDQVPSLSMTPAEVPSYESRK